MVIASLAMVAVLAGALMGFSHYWLPIALGRDINPPWTYCIGVGLGILVPFGAWCLFYWLVFRQPMPWWLAVIALVVVTAGAGLFVLVAYDTDNRHRVRQELRQRQRDTERDNQRG